MLEKHRFFCVNCGREGLPVYRSQARQRGKLHRKKLYCIYCGQQVNMVECYDDLDVEEFKRDFERGVYTDEAQESIIHCGGGSK